jgi:ATP-binding cassette subfamily D (ALD) long-chain fatty acid import protein
MEKSVLKKTYTRLIKHINSIYRVRIAYNMFEDFIIKYSWSAVGLLLASIPVFYPMAAGSRTKREDALVDSMHSSSEIAASARTGNRTQGFITNKR